MVQMMGKESGTKSGSGRACSGYSGSMMEQNSLKRLPLRVALRPISPMVIRLIAVPDGIDLADFKDIFCAVLGWSGRMGHILRVHGQEFNSFRRKTRAHTLREFKLHRQEKFLYVCDTLHSVGVGC
jgi:hypothetical protein